MPTYRYDCTACGSVLEVFQSMSARKRRKCPECGGKLEQRIGGGGGVLLKGGGFYTTDYRSESYKRAEKSDKEPSAGKKETKKDASKKDASKGAKPKKKPPGKDA